MRRRFFYLVLAFIFPVVFNHTLHGTAAAYELFVVGENGASYHYDGDKWRDIGGKPADRITEDLRGVWASTPDNVYAVSSEGGIYNYDGARWSEVARPTTKLNDIWGSSENDIYAAGENVYHYDGGSWNLFLETYIVDICGTSSANIYFAGNSGVYQYNGSEVNRIGLPSGDTNMLGIWASDENNVFVAIYIRYYYDEYLGYFCLKNFYHYDGLDWTSGNCDCDLAWPACFHFEGGIWGTTPDNVWATGGGYICVNDGVCWDMVNATGTSGTDIWGTASDDIYFCTYNNGVVHYDGASFTHVLPEDDYGLFDLTLYAICGVGESLTPSEMPKPGQFLSQNYPNPFNPNTTISFSIGGRGQVSLAVYDVEGRLVRVLVDDVMDAGPHDVTWDGRDKAGRTVASGAYFYRLEAGNFTETKTMVLLR